MLVDVPVDGCMAACRLVLMNGVKLVPVGRPVGLNPSPMGPSIHEAALAGPATLVQSAMESVLPPFSTVGTR